MKQLTSIGVALTIMLRGEDEEISGRQDVAKKPENELAPTPEELSLASEKPSV